MPIMLELFFLPGDTCVSPLRLELLDVPLNISFLSLFFCAMAWSILFFADFWRIFLAEASTSYTKSLSSMDASLSCLDGVEGLMIRGGL